MSEPASRADTGPLHASFSLGRWAGVEIGANWSWIVIFLLICWSLAAAVFPEAAPGLGAAAYVAMAAVGAVLFFVSLLLHELGHAVVARREGMEIDGIVLWLFGGVARFKGLFPSAGAELRIALAGPLVSLVIGLAMLGLGMAPLPDAVGAVVVWLGSINIILLVFNMLPALPLDGGRVFRALLWRRTGDFTRATRVAGSVGRLFGQAMIAGGFLLLLLLGAPGGLWLALIGWFLIAAAGAEMRMATIAVALGPLRVADAMATAPVVAPAAATLAGFIETRFSGSRHAAYPVLDGDRVVGMLGFRDLAAVPTARWDETTVAAVARPVADVLVLAPDASLGDATVELVQDDLGRALVLEGDRLVGLLSMTDVSRLIELRTGAEAGGSDRAQLGSASPLRQ
ncbi:MAG: site-2 protease family protein [Thermoleophilia bacterium]|nr:site-2 protease family protein [Thermoleophilia bacterium]